MGPILIAVLLIVAGGVVRVIGPSVLGPTAAGGGRAKLLAYGLMFAGLVAAGMNTVVVIDVGEVGVQHFLGKVTEVPLGQGVHVINPLASVEIMSVREQSFPPNGGVEQIEAQTSEQMNVALEVSLLYRIDPARAPDLYARIGSEDLIVQSITQTPSSAAAGNGDLDVVFKNIGADNVSLPGTEFTNYVAYS